MAALKKLSASVKNIVIFGGTIEISIVLVPNRLKPRSGPTYVGPDMGCSLFAIL